MRTTQERDEVAGSGRPTTGELPRPWRRAAPLAALRLARLTLARRSGRMLLVALGTIMAVVLICTVPLYSTLVAGIQLQAAINGVGPVGRNVEAVVGTSSISVQAQQEEDGIIRPQGAQSLASFTQPQVTSFLTAEDTMTLDTVSARPVNLPGGDRFEAMLQAFDYAQISAHMRLLAGTLPAAAPADGSPLEALITAQMAQMLHVQVGDAVTLTVRQPTVQSAVLRTIGMGSRQVLSMLLWEQAIVYAGALVGGTAVGLVLTLATVPFLQFSDTSLDPVMLGVPSFALVANPAAVVLFYLGVAASLVVAMAFTARYAARRGLGRALRIGEE
jgi:hypothetical protein